MGFLMIVYQKVLHAVPKQLTRYNGKTFGFSHIFFQRSYPLSTIDSQSGGKVALFFFKVSIL